MVLREALSRKDTPFANLILRDKDSSSNDDRPASSQVRPGYRPNKRLSATERAQLAEQYQLGMSALELARKYKIHPTTAMKHVRSEGVVVRGGQVKMTPVVLERAKQLYASGNSLAMVGEQLGVDTTTVHKALKRVGVKMRDSQGRAT